MSFMIHAVLWCFQMESDPHCHRLSNTDQTKPDQTQTDPADRKHWKHEAVKESQWTSSIDDFFSHYPHQRRWSMLGMKFKEMYLIKKILIYVREKRNTKYKFHWSHWSIYNYYTVSYWNTIHLDFNTLYKILDNQVCNVLIYILSYLNASNVQQESKLIEIQSRIESQKQFLQQCFWMLLSNTK